MKQIRNLQYNLFSPDDVGHVSGRCPSIRIVEKKEFNINLSMHCWAAFTLTGDIYPGEELPDCMF